MFLPTSTCSFLQPLLPPSNGKCPHRKRPRPATLPADPLASGRPAHTSNNRFWKPFIPFHYKICCTACLAHGALASIRTFCNSWNSQPQTVSHFTNSQPPESIDPLQRRTFDRYSELGIDPNDTKKFGALNRALPAPLGA